MDQQININNYILLDRLSNIIDIYNIIILDHENDEEILSKEEKEQMLFVLSDLYEMVGERIYKLYEGENNNGIWI